MPDSDPFLTFAMKHRCGALGLNVQIALRAEWSVLFGPSGSGKSTILRAIQGIIAPPSCSLTLRGRAIADTSRRLSPPAYRRPIRGAGQSARLFPRMTVRENIAWGAPGEAGLLAEVLALFGLEDLATSYPAVLSGGEQQRVSVARAVASAAATDAALLLLDEPFSGQDLALRDALAIGLRDWLRSRRLPVLSVTHDVAEAFLLDAEVLRLEAGRITAQGPAAEVLAHERERLLQQLHAMPLRSR